METNIFPIKIEFDEFQILRTPYSDERLKELRSSHNQTHSFFRNGEFIYISNKDGDESLSLGEPVTIKTYENFEITSSLIKHIFFRTFKEKFPNIIPIDFYPFRIISTQQKDDIAREYLTDKLKDKIYYKKHIEVQLRLINNEGRRFFGFVINTYRKWGLTKSCKELHDEGFQLVGSEVLHTEKLPGLENILAPNEEFVGYILSISGEDAEVNTNFGNKIIPLTELSLRKTKFNIKNYISFATSESICDKIFKVIETKKSEFLNLKNERNEILSIAKLFSQEQASSGIRSEIVYQNKDGFCFSVDSNPLSPQSNSLQLQTPVFIFDHAGTKTNNINPDMGLTTFGPYDSLIFDTKAVNIMAICAKDNRGSFSSFLANLIEGLPQSKYFKKGLKKKYDLLEVTHAIHEVGKYEYSEYERIISSIEVKPHLAIIEIPEEFKELEDSSNPYYKLKARLLTLEIPVQFVLSRKIRRHDEYLLNSIALQIYAKLGGTPWVLPSSRSVDRELIIGIGHSMIRKNSFSGAEQNRVVGITTFFSSDGQYLLSNKAKDVPYQEYFAELLKNLRESFQRLHDEQGWKDGDTIRLIFHIFKPIRNIEFEVVCELMKQFSQYKIQFAFVTISKSHPLMIFEPSQTGIRNSYSSNVKGEYIPYRGANIIIDDTSCLIQMLGAKEIKTDRHGASNPILVRIRVPQGNFDSVSIEGFLFTDLQYIIQQIFSFSYLSWRSFLPGEQPATMLYSNLISRLLGKLRKIEGWQPDVLNFNLKRKKWFL